MRNLLLPLIAMLSTALMAGGPPATVGHLDIEITGGQVRATLRIPFTVAQAVGGFDAFESNQKFVDDLFVKTLGEKPVRTGDDVCKWLAPLGVVSFVAIRLQATAECSVIANDIQIELPFMQQTKPGFILSVYLHQQGEKRVLEMSNRQSSIILSVGHKN